MENINLARAIMERLPSEALDVMRKAASLAGGRGEKLYLVGGAVRDLLLFKPVADIDLVVEGDAIALARELALADEARLTPHQPFLTATLQWPSVSIDLTTARSESYERPGALPAVKPGSLQEDLFRRDFSVNAMAVSLNPGDYGQLVDYYGGLADLRHKLVRVLHDKSFTDDATRMWRAVRYEQRLDFCIENGTLALLKRNLPMLKTITGERIWYELECVFGEQLPEKVLARAGELGLLAYLDSGLKAEGWLPAWFDNARRLSMPGRPSDGLYLALLTFKLDSAAIDRLINYLKLTRGISQTVQETQKIRALHEELSEEIMQPSAIYQHLHGFSEEALKANLIASESAEVCRNIRSYLDELRYAKTQLNGDDLMSLGVKQGPNISLMLGLLLDAKLDGEVSSREDEVRLLKTEKIIPGSDSPDEP